MEQTYYKIMYQKKNDDSGTWYAKKGYYAKQEQAQKYIDILEQVSDIYSVLRLESFIVSVPDPQEQNKKAAGESRKK